MNIKEEKLQSDPSGKGMKLKKTDVQLHLMKQTMGCGSISTPINQRRYQKEVLGHGA